jgi:tetratricopeptide (TPR) repeat protein
MEVFGWVEQLVDQLIEADQPDLARAIYALPTSAVEQHSAGWESDYHTVLAAARELENPWLEAYAHHWASQSRVSRDGAGRIALNDVISAVERSHHPDCIDCPQTVCLVQDLATVYSVTDRAGYINERLEVVDETLARIDRSWTCFHCLHRERADALHDAGRHEEALATLQISDDLLIADGEDLQWHSCIRPNALIQLGRTEEALVWMIEADDHDDDEDDATWFGRQVVKAYALALLDRVDEAVEVIPPAGDLVGGDYGPWRRAAEEIVKRGGWDNDWQYGATLQRMTKELIAKGNGSAVELAETHCRRAVDRGARWTASNALDQFVSAQQILRDPDRVDSIAAELRALLDGMGQDITLPVPPLELVEHLSDNLDPEKEIDLLLLAQSQAPDDDGLAVQVVRALFALGEVEMAHSSASDALNRQPESVRRATELRSLLDNADDADGQRALATRLQTTQPRMHHSILANLAFGESEYEITIVHCKAMVALDAEELPGRRLWAQATIKMNDPATALRLHNEIIAILDGRNEDSTSDRWDSLSSATLAGEWALVRNRATAMGMTFPEGTGPIDEEWAIVRVAYDEVDSDGDRVIASGIRTGPVTVRVLSVSPPQYPVKTGDVVVFDAAPLNPKPVAASGDEDGDEDGDDENDESESWTPIFPIMGVLSEGNMTSWIIDGVTPSEEEWETFRNEIRESGWGLWALSPDEYTVTNPLDEDEELPAVYAALASPADVSARMVHDRLTLMTADWDHPIAWLNLAKAAEVDQAEIERQEKIVEDYDL